MSQPRKLQDPAYKRLILFPLAIFYMMLLVAAGWPSQLSPRSRVMEAIQMAANHALAQLAIQPSVNIFTGDTGGIRTATLQICYEVRGYTQDREHEVLFDSMPECADSGLLRSKDHVAWFQNQYLRRGIGRLHTPGAKLIRNEPPLNILFSIADYHCHRQGENKYASLVIKSRRKWLNLDTGERHDRTIIEGVHQCQTGRWDIIRRLVAPAQKESGDGA